MKSGTMRIATIVAAIGIGLAGSVYALNARATDWLMKESSRIASTKWTDQLVSNVDNIEGIANGEAPTAAAMRYLNFVANSNNVDHFDIYNNSGELVLESEKIGDFRRRGDPLAKHNPEALNALRNGQPSVVIDVEEDGEGQTILAETYLPIIKDGKAVGVASVYIDQTEMAALLQQKFTIVSLLIGGLCAIAFAFPAIGAIVQMQRRQEADAEVAYLAHHDVLTDMFNRRTMEKELQGILDQCGRNGKLAALHFIDVDYFKELNDRFGHSFGDEVLKAFAVRLKECMRPGDMASRFGGDEFVIVQTGFESIEDLATHTAKMTKALSRPYTILDKAVVVTSSIGTAMYPDNDVAADDLLYSADVALYVVKSLGRNGQRFFEPEFANQKHRHAELEMLLRESLASRAFELHYQPLYRLKESRLKGFEALLRMKDRDGRYVSPAEFVPVAEEVGVIDEIGRWCLDEACRQAALWPAHLQVSVNLSAVQFRRKSVTGAVDKALRKSGLQPDRLVLEVTESLLMTDADGVLDQLNQLKAMGCTLAMDDFGTGYSSLSYMMRFPFDRLKIDRSFVTQLNADHSKGRKLVQTIVALGHSMEMAVTAEGVETASQAVALNIMNCDDVQGYLYSKPVPVTELASLILRDHRAQTDGPEPEKQKLWA